jgi:hypothetical protein
VTEAFEVCAVERQLGCIGDVDDVMNVHRDDQQAQGLAALTKRLIDEL